MSKFKYGRWACTYTSNHAHDYRLTKPDGSPLPVNAGANDHSEQRAYARLIAAAPTILQELIRAREYIAACIQPHAETVTNPTPGLVDDPDDVLALEADQDLLNGIDAAIATATGAA